MEAYAYDGEVDDEQLQRFVQSKRTLANARDHYFLYLFDTAESVRYPKTERFTGGFNGIEDDEIEAMKHVRAIYETTNFNNHSQLTVYEINSLEGPSRRYHVK